MTTTRDRDIPHLIGIADELGVSVIEQNGPTRGGYHDGLRRIRINSGMSQRAARSYLAHECAHALFRDVRSPYGPVAMKQERRAWEWAATYLICPDEFAEAETIRGGHAPSMAYDLDVTVELITAYRRTLHRIGEVTYMQPRMGAGQWSLKVAVNA